MFSEQNLNAFEEFKQNNPNFLETVGLSSDECTKKIKLLAIASLGNESNTFTYDQIAKNLNIGASEVEYWIISGVSAQLIEAKMDQSREQVFIR